MPAHEQLTLETLDITTPELYRDHGYPWAAWDLLRREAPVFRYKNFMRTDARASLGDVWIISKHEDIMEISRNPNTWNQHPELTAPKNGIPQRHIIAMDPPEHAVYRNLTSRHFTPRAMQELEARIDELSVEIIDDVVERLLDRVRGEGRCEFVFDLAMRLPVYAICELLGVPREDAEQMFHWSDETSAPSDPEFQKGRTEAETSRQGTEQILGYFKALADERRTSPKNDLMTVLVQATIDGEPLPELEVLQNAWLILLGGNETTRNVTSGGMLAMIEHPDEMARLRDDPSIAPSAAEEALRWTSPIISFLRTATEDTSVRGQEIKEGESVALYYPSANRDEDVFDDPYRFDLTREPNPHLAFGGYGEHFCIGANLARLELRTTFGQILERMPEIELDGPPDRLLSSLLGGIKHMPVKFKVKTVVGA